jgi:predicted nuclease of restriction endonuclease-like (RecB) superfamily
MNIVAQNRNEQFAEIVSMIQHTRSEVVRLANASLIDLYWRVGQYISDKIAVSEWGDGVVKQLAEYIEKTAPETKGFSDKNLWRMKQFYETYKDEDEKLSTLLRQISWSHNLAIMSRAKSVEERQFYLRLCVHDRLSFRQLNRQIDSALYERNALGAPKLSPVLREIAPQAEQIFRDQYVMEFLGGKEYKHENGMKAALIGQMKKFKPEHLGQLNFYLEALDRDVKKPKENPSIGILLCKDKDNTVVEYALSRSLSPTMVAEYQLCLPDKALLQQKMLDVMEEDSTSNI